tara:strand:+ start:274 stop:414 length:141 start_codon:yes stop_codon:yes gene_type:complete
VNIEKINELKNKENIVSTKILPLMPFLYEIINPKIIRMERIIEALS